MKCDAADCVAFTSIALLLFGMVRARVLSTPVVLGAITTWFIGALAAGRGIWFGAPRVARFGMSSVCQSCRTIVPAGAAFCPNCGRPVGTGTVPYTPAPPPPPGSQWQQQPPWPQQPQQPQWQTQGQWTQPTVRTGPGCAAWLVGCAVVLALCFIALVVIGLMIGANTKPTNQQRHTTTRRTSWRAGETQLTAHVARQGVAGSYDGARAMKIISCDVAFVERFGVQSPARFRREARPRSNVLDLVSR